MVKWIVEVAKSAEHSRVVELPDGAVPLSHKEYYDTYHEKMGQVESEHVEVTYIRPYCKEA